MHKDQGGGEIPIDGAAGLMGEGAASPEIGGELELQLEPTLLRETDRYKLDSNAAESLAADLAWTARAELGAVVAHDPHNFSAAYTAACMRGRVEQARTTLIRDAVTLEQSRSYGDKTVSEAVMASFGADALHSKAPIVPSSSFMGGILQELDEERDVLEPLGRLLKGYEGTKVLDLVRDTYAALRAPGGADVDGLYQLIEAAAGRPEDYTLSRDQARALYSVMFLPASVRKFVRPIIKNNIVLAETRRQLGDAITPDEQATLDAIDEYLTAGCLSNYDWQALVDEHGCGAQTATAMSVAGARQFAALRTIQQYHREGRAQSALDSYNAAAVRISDRLEATINHYPQLHFWELTDSGHCFTGFTDDSLLVNVDMALTTEVPEKNGRTAVILEDDLEQQAAWQRAIGDHTPYTVEPGAVVSDPADLDQLLETPRVGLFVLDVEGVNGPSTGIEVGRRILEHRLGQLAAGSVEYDPTTVVVWSSSEAAMQAAHKALTPLATDEKNPDGKVGYSVPGRHYTPRNGALRLIIGPKLMYTIHDV